MSHTCPALCGRTVDNDDILMCASDWRRVPEPVQRKVMAAWDRGRGKGSARLLRAQQAAIASLGGDPAEAAP